jgi:hypothetical protein
MLRPEDVARYQEVLKLIERIRLEAGDPERGSSIERMAKKALESIAPGGRDPEANSTS